MKFLHLADLHLGKRVNEFSMLEDQAYILEQILEIVDREQADAVWIAGDVYDRPVPPEEAVRLFDHFLTALAERKKPVFFISGNHDSAERVAFGAQLIAESGIHTAPVYDGNVVPVELEDAYGKICVWMLPFVKPAVVRHAFPEREIATYQDAVQTAIEAMQVDPACRNVLICHQFVTGAARCDSEETAVGGMDDISASLFDGFDYTALGHLHGPQQVGRETVRYAGSPLKYSFSEAGQKKAAVIVELQEKGKTDVRLIPLVPLHDMREIRGSYLEVSARDFYRGTAVEDYLHITLTDEEDIPDAVGKLRNIYPNLMRLDYDNRRTRNTEKLEEETSVESRKPEELIADFYRMQNGAALNDAQLSYMQKLLEKIGEGKV